MSKFHESNQKPHLNDNLNLDGNRVAVFLFHVHFHILRSNHIVFDKSLRGFVLKAKWRIVEVEWVKLIEMCVCGERAREGDLLRSNGHPPLMRADWSFFIFAR